MVIVADAGRDVGGPRGPDEIVALSDGRFGFRMVHPTRGDRRGVFAWDAVKEAAGDQERSERLRLYYVAMTRAIDRLIVSGAIDPDRTADRSTPIGWVLERLDAYGTVLDDDEAPSSLRATTPASCSRSHATGPRTRSHRRTRSSPWVKTRPDELQLALFDELPAGRPRLGIELPELGAIPMPPAHDVRRLSYSALALYERCSYRFYAERVLGLPPRVRAAGESGGGGGLAATEIGDAVHRLLELVPLDAPASPPRASLDETVRGWYPEITEDELERVAGLVDVYCASPLAARLASLRGARPERPFTFEHDGVLIRGRLDVLWHEGERALIVDYKSNALEGRDPHDIVEAEYRLQRLVYALVCLRAGSSEVEISYQFLERPDTVVSATFARDDIPELEAELSGAIARIRTATFGRRRASSSAPTARHSTSSAPGRDSRSLVRFERCASPRSATSTATCRRSKRCSQTSSARASRTSSSPATPSPGRGRSRSSSVSSLPTR